MVIFPSPPSRCVLSHVLPYAQQSVTWMAPSSVSRPLSTLLPAFVCKTLTRVTSVLSGTYPQSRGLGSAAYQLSSHRRGQRELLILFSTCHIRRYGRSPPPTAAHRRRRRRLARNE